jgi:hypothetical protein
MKRPQEPKTTAKGKDDPSAPISIPRLRYTKNISIIARVEAFLKSAGAMDATGRYMCPDSNICPCMDEHFRRYVTSGRLQQCGTRNCTRKPKDNVIPISIARVKTSPCTHFDTVPGYIHVVPVIYCSKTCRDVDAVEVAFNKHMHIGDFYAAQQASEISAHVPPPVQVRYQPEADK